jgi:PAS domain S-box-containing protein
MDKLIQRQLRRARLSPDALPTDLVAWQDFLDRVDRSYQDHERERYLLERSLDVSSREMQTLYDELRRSSASEVAAERDKLGAIITGFRDGFCSLDLDGRLVSMNPAAARLLGEGETSVGAAVLARFRYSDPTDGAARASPEQILERVRSGRSYRDDKAVLVNPGAETTPVSLLIYPIVQGGLVTGCALSFRDVSRLLAAEAARRRLAKAVEASADAIYVTDLSGVIEYVNPAFSRITGINAEQAIGARPSLLADEHRAPEDDRDLWETIRRGEVWSGRRQDQRLMPDGGTRAYWAQTTIAPLPDDSGTLVGFVAVQRDISREVAEEMRRTREVAVAEARAHVAERLQGTGHLEQRLAEALDPLAALQTLRLSGDVLVIDCRQAHAPLTLLQRGAPGPPDLSLESLCRADRVPLHPTHLPSLGGILLPIVQAGSVLGCAWLGVDGTPDLDGAESGLLAFVAGMIGVAIADDQARTEAERARLAALEAVETRSRFLANMSHEIRTPMNGVLGMLEMLTQTRLDRDQQEYVETALGSAEALLRVINDILDFSKIEAGKLDLERVPFDVRSLTEEIATLFAARSSSDRLELACYIPVDLDTRVVGDPTRLRQVLNNLMGNATKFTETGEIVLRVRALDEPGVQGHAAKRVLRFEVSDTGIGMTPAQLERLFVPFVQADGSTTRRFGGTGLGLAISKQLVELMGGEIGVESRFGQGSTFWATIPFDGLAAEPRVPGPERLAAARVLAVDDNETNRRILDHYLRSWGLRCEMASDGNEALRLLWQASDAGRPFEIAILDMHMPQLDGIALAHQIRAQPALAQTRLLMISSTGQSADALEAVGIEYSLSKPIRQSHLYDALAHLIDQDTRDARPGVAAMGPAGTNRPSEQEPRLRGHVLLVEDNVINQRVALSMLERLGLTADLAQDGYEALAAVDRHHYDLILMDCQMPQMDGFETSAELRRREAQDGRPRSVIVALTANAMQGDRDRCVAAGMDDYLPKPVKLARLREVLGHWLPSTPGERSPITGDLGGHLGWTMLPPTLDPDVIHGLRERLGDDYAQCLDLFFARTEGLLEDLKAAAERADAASVATAAHALANSAGALGASALSELGRRMEQRATAGDLRGIEDLLVRTRQARDGANAALRRLVALDAAR